MILYDKDLGLKADGGHWTDKNCVSFKVIPRIQQNPSEMKDGIQ